MDSSVEKIKEKLSIQEVVGGYVPLQRAGHNFRARCPFHKEKTPSFMVSPDRGTYMCFGCGERGDIFSFVQKMDGIDFPTALAQLAERAGVVLERRASPERAAQHKEKEERLREVCEASTDFFVEQLKNKKEVIDYLHTRGATDETILNWRIGYAPASWDELSKHLVEKGFTKDEIADAGLAAKSDKKPGEIYDRFRGRIMFPIFDLNGKVIAFSGRFYEKVQGSREEGDPAKYVNSPETDLFKKSKILYGLDRAKGFIRKADCILLVEGQFDLVLSHQSGLPFAVAVSGTALTQEHLMLLSRFSKRMVLALDADEAGIRAGLRSTAMAYANGFDVKIPTFIDAKDPADVARENPELLRAAVRTSQTAIEFFLGVLRPGAKDERAYKQLVDRNVLPLIAALPSRIDQEHFARIVAQKIGVSEEAVRAELAKKPASQSEIAQEGSTPALTPLTIPPFENAAAMLIFYFGADAAMQDKIKTIVGAQRYEEIKKKYTDDAERFKFSFEALGDEQEKNREALEVTLRRVLISEQMDNVRRKLQNTTPGEEGKLLVELATLKRQEQDLRN